MSIIISQGGKNAKKIDKSDFEKEDYLQNYIHQNPESIPVYEIEEDKRLFVVMREFPTESGPIDALAVDKDGDIYIVETKLYKNPDKRTVVAQALDYGAALWNHFGDFMDFLSMLDKETTAKFKLNFKDKVKEFFSLDDTQAAALLNNMRMNLHEGNIKYVILMDSMDDRLKDLIIYVNQNSQFDIYAVQLEYYKFKEYEIMIPKMFGVEVKKNVKTSAGSPRKEWNEESFVRQAKELMGGNADKVIELYNFFKNKADKIKWGTGSVNGSFAPIFYKLHKNISPFSIYSNGEIQCKFKWLFGRAPDDLLEKYYERFITEYKNTGLKAPENVSDGEFTISKEIFLRNSKIIFDAIKTLAE